MAKLKKIFFANIDGRKVPEKEKIILREEQLGDVTLISPVLQEYEFYYEEIKYRVLFRDGSESDYCDEPLDGTEAMEERMDIAYAYGLSVIDGLDCLREEITIPKEVYYKSASKKLPVVSVGNYAFSNSTVNRVRLPDGITRIEYDAFGGSRELEEVKLSGQLRYIGKSAFLGCSALKRIAIPRTVSTIDTGAFAGCDALETVELLCSSVVIGVAALNHTPWYRKVIEEKDEFVTINGNILVKYNGNSSEVIVPDGIISIIDRVFLNNRIITRIKMPDSIVCIGGALFYGCKNLMEVRLSKNIKVIPEDTFRDCARLSCITMPKKLTRIGTSAFGGCTSLLELRLPFEMQKIATDAFDSCTKLKYLYLPEFYNKEKERILELNNHLYFKECDNLTTIYVPAGTEEDYKKSIPRYADYSTSWEFEIRNE